MTKHLVSPIVPPLISTERFSKNGMLPNAHLARRLAETFNFVGARQKKQVFLKSQALDAVDAGLVASVIWPGYFRTGENTNALRVLYGVCYTDFGFAATPYVQLVLRDSGGSTVTEPKWTFKADTSGTDVGPNEVALIADTIEEGINPNTVYQHVTVCANGPRVVFMSITEAITRHADDSLTGVCNPGEVAAEGPIYDAHVGDLVDANNKLWRHNGSHLISWATDYDVDAGPVVTLTSYRNVADLASTTVTNASPGWKLHTQYHNTVNRTTIPVLLAVRTDRILGAGTLDLRFTDGTNNLDITGIGDTGGGWSTVAGTIPAQAGTKWDLWGKVSGVGTEHRIQAMSLFEYEA